MPDLYNVSSGVVNSSLIISFLIFSLANIPINHFIDKKGLRFSFAIGTGLYLIGAFFYCLINVSFPLVIVGYSIFSLGQPFILNCPAKIATFWFLPKNVNPSSFLENSCHINYGWMQSLWLWTRLRHSSARSQRKRWKFSDETGDIWAIYWLFFRNVSDANFKLFPYESQTFESYFKDGGHETIESEIIFPVDKKRQEFMEILSSLLPSLWNFHHIWLHC